MIRSLRWRLQAWQALILLLALAGFGSVLYLEIRRARFDEIDAELLAAGRVLEGSLRAFPRFLLRGDSAPPRKKELPPDHLVRQEHLDRTLDLPKALQHRHAESHIPPYFLVRRADGSLFRSSPEAPELPVPAYEDWPSGERPYARQEGPIREVLLRGPERILIQVGRSTGREMHQLNHLGWMILLTGLAVFGIALAGGWWLSRSAVRSIEVMSDTAETITASNLSQRIDLTTADTELGKLGEILNEMLTRLEQSFVQQVRFTADASHELRTPLSVLLTHIELALGRPRSPEEYRTTLTTCQRAGERMKALVEDLLTLARADAGKLELCDEVVDLRSLVEDVGELLAPLATQRGVSLIIEGESVEVTGDPARLAQVATNLLTNAILYNRPGGQVTLRTCQVLEEGELSVSDTGIGISETDLAHVFERFYRVDKARSRESGGSGLGLAICKSIVEAHGGRISVSSRQGAGTTFTVRLPLEASTPDEEE